jgi:alkanesulfonate monooxygenase SsuD/methylene tetrahydromethanopterin reductase-like flavin-dependent oxidoreductase (luciferase family)
LRRLWSGEMRYPPVQPPRVPILIAGGGEKHTLRQVAQYASNTAATLTDRSPRCWLRTVRGR